MLYTLSGIWQLYRSLNCSIWLVALTLVVVYKWGEKGLKMYNDEKTHVSHIYTLRWLLQTKTKLMGGTNNNSHKQNVTLRRPTKATKKRKHVKSMLFILRFSLFALRKQVVAGAIRMGGGWGWSVDSQWILK